MSWYAEQVYTIANSELIVHLQQIEKLKPGLFKVDNLEEGIRSEWTKEIFFLNENHERKEIKHELPKAGLLVINPSMHRISYADKAELFYTNYREYVAHKWDFINDLELTPIELPLTLTMEQKKLFTYLKQLNREFEQPFVYYNCSMWAGQIEEEIVVVFDGDIRIYYFNEEKQQYWQQIGNDSSALIEGTALQKGLLTIGLNLPTHFFALHETSFDWQSYQV